MSRLRVDDITDLATQAYKGTRGWMNFDGAATVVSIRTAFNMSSLVDNGTGNYTLNITSVATTAAYPVTMGDLSFSATQVSRQANLKGVLATGAIDKTTGTFGVVCGATATAALADMGEVHVVLHW